MFGQLHKDRQATGVERWTAVIVLGVTALLFDIFALLALQHWLTKPAHADPTSWGGLLVMGGLAFFFNYLPVRVARSSSQEPAFGIVLRSVVGLLALAAGLKVATIESQSQVYYALLCLGFAFVLLRSVVVMWRQGHRPFGLGSRSSRGADS